MVWYLVWQGGMHGRGHIWEGHVRLGASVAGEMATAAGSMHLTGMHSCFNWMSENYQNLHNFLQGFICIL